MSANYYHVVTGEIGRCGALNDVTDDLPTNTCPRDSHSDDDEDETLLCSPQEVDSIVLSVVEERAGLLSPGDYRVQCRLATQVGPNKRGFFLNIETVSFDGEYL